MALTRPRFTSITTSVVLLSDPLTVLHGGVTAADVDVGFLINRANGLVSNVALYWNESGQSFVTAFTSNTGVTDTNVAVTSYANITTGAHTITPGTELSSTNTTTGALVVTGGVGVSGAVNIGTSLTVDGGSYGNVVATQFGSVFATAYGPNNYSLLQAWSPATGGALGLNAYGNVIYSSGAITFRTGAAIRDKDYPTGGTLGVQIASNGAVIASTGIASTSTGTGAVIVTGGAGVSGNLYVAGNIVQTGTGYHTIPVGTTAQRPVTAASGMIRYNTTLSSFEGYGAAWASLGGVKSVDGNTYILAEATVGAGDNTLWFYNNATNTARLSTANLTLLQSTTSTSTTTGALQVAGGVGIAGNLYVGSNLIVPVGTTNQRGSVQGAIRYNTTTSAFESYDGATWNKLAYGTGGDFPTGDFGDLTTLTDAFGVATSTTYDSNAAGTVITSDLAAAGTASLAPI